MIRDIFDKYSVETLDMFPHSVFFVCSWLCINEWIKKPNCSPSKQITMSLKILQRFWHNICIYCSRSIGWWWGSCSLTTRNCIETIIIRWAMGSVSLLNYIIIPYHLCAFQFGIRSPPFKSSNLHFLTKCDTCVIYLIVWFT